MTTAFKLFRVKKCGNITSLFINKSKNLPLNKWIRARNFPTPGFKVRPGWHCVPRKHAPHLSLRNRKWLKIAIKDYSVLQKPKNQGGQWFLAKYMKIYA